jgi:hypothetical protein
MGLPSGPVSVNTTLRAIQQLELDLRVRRGRKRPSVNGIGVPDAAAHLLAERVVVDHALQHRHAEVVLLVADAVVVARRRQRRRSPRLSTGARAANWPERGCMTLVKDGSRLSQRRQADGLALEL